MPFVNENVAAGLPANSKIKIGRANVDSPTPLLEAGTSLPWSSDKAATWVYYECAIGVMLDSGIVVHNRLPQVDNEYDTIAAANLNDPNLDRLTGFGVNLRCNDQYTDIVQRMGHARYWFRLWGQAIRVGYQVPIPTIKTIGGVEAIPYDKNPQWGYNAIAPGGNYGGVILWRAQWSLWFTTATQPVKNMEQDLLVDPSAHINGQAKVPDSIQAPYSQPDDNATRALPTPKGRTGAV